MGVVCGAMVLAVWVFVTQAMKPEEGTEPDKFERMTEALANALEKQEPWYVGSIRGLCAKGMSQREIGRALGMHQKSVWRIMKRYGIKKA